MEETKCTAKSTVGTRARPPHACPTQRGNGGTAGGQRSAYPCAAFAFHRGQVSRWHCQPCRHTDPRPCTADRQETRRLLSADPRAPFITVSLPPMTPFNSAPTLKPGRSPLKRPQPRHSPFISSSEDPPSPPHPRYRFNCFNHPQPVGPPTRLLFVAPSPHQDPRDRRMGSRT